MTTTANKQSAADQSIPAKMREKYDAIMALTDAFCRDRLNPEYQSLIRSLAGTLARKRPSPLVNGTAAAWACGIVRTIGWVNFLDDRAQTPHVKLTEVDRAFGVSTGTGAGKSKIIRDMLKIYRFSAHWTLPSRMADNPMVWLIECNGMIVDIRCMPREVQELAFERGMIPYVPEDRKTNAADDSVRGPDSNETLNDASAVRRESGPL